MIGRISREVAKGQGLKRYFTGHPCGRGHIAERFVADGRCVQCNRERQDREHRNRDNQVVAPLLLHVVRDYETEQIIRESRRRDDRRTYTEAGNHAGRLIEND
jgi:hypothetical protein